MSVMAAPPLPGQRDRRTPAEKGEILDPERVASGDIEYWYRHYTGKGFQKRQKEFAYAALRERHVAMVACRQSGKTEIVIAVIGFILCFFRDEDIGAYAPTKDQALHVLFDRVVKLFKSHPDLEDMLASEPMKSGYLEMLNGNTFRVQTAAKDAYIRGFSPTTVIIDESAFIHDEKYFSDIMASRGSRKNIMAEDLEIIQDMTEEEQEEYLTSVAKEPRVLEISTPMGRNHFFVLCQSGSKAVVIKQPHWESPVVPRWLVAQAEEDMTEREFLREYCCVFDEDTQYTFPREQVTAACVIDPHEPHERRGLEYVCGIDLGQKQDHTVFTILELNGYKRRMVFYHRFDTGMKWGDMAFQMAEFYQIWKPDLTYIDRTGPGEMVFLQHLLPYTMSLNWMMEGWEYGQISKSALMRNLQILLEDGNLILWKDRVLMKEFFVNLEERSKLSGIPTYPKPKGEKDDIIQSIALASMAASVLQPHTSPHYDVNIVAHATRLDDTQGIHRVPGPAMETGPGTNPARQSPGRMLGTSRVMSGGRVMNGKPGSRGKAPQPWK